MVGWISKIFKIALTTVDLLKHDSSKIRILTIPPTITTKMYLKSILLYEVKGQKHKRKRHGRKKEWPLSYMGTNIYK